MSLRKYLLTGGLSAVLLLGACSDDGSSDEGQAEDEATGKNQAERLLMNQMKTDHLKRAQFHIPENMGLYLQ
ncbi:hypothetical protein [Salinicoccus sp. CNSTN-B1]